KYILRDFEAANIIVNNLLKLNPEYAEAQLLSAQIAFEQENYTGCLYGLDRALSFNFEIRDWPEYNLLKAKVQSAKAEYKAALDTLDYALKVLSKEHSMLNIKITHQYREKNQDKTANNTSWNYYFIVS